MAENFTDEQAKIVDSLLLEAVEAGDYERIALCLKKGADIDARNSSGRTPLMMAVWRENPLMAQFLLKQAPSLFLKDKSGKTAYDLIAEVHDTSKRKTITEFLLHALPDHVRRRAATPVQAAALAEAEANDNSNVTTGADITVSKPLVLPLRKNPKGFSL